MTTRAIEIDGNTITLNFGPLPGDGYCVCTRPCPPAGVTQENFRRVRFEDQAVVCTRVAPPNHVNTFGSVFADSLFCMS